MSYVLDQPVEYQTSTKENKMASICPVFKWCSSPRYICSEDPNAQNLESFEKQMF